MQDIKRLTLAEVRPHILRAYYERRFDTPGHVDQFEGATFEEYVALLRIVSPRMSARRAAQVSPQYRVPQFVEFLDQLSEPPDDGPEAKKHAHAGASRTETFDLASLPKPSEIELLTLDRVKQLCGVQALGDVVNLQKLVVTLCGTTELAPSARRLKLGVLDLANASDRLEKLVLHSTSAQEISLVSNSSVVDLRPLKAHSQLQACSITAPFIRNTAALEGLPVKALNLSRVAVNGELTSTLVQLGSHLQALSLVGVEQFGPAALPFAALQNLKRVCIPGYPQFRAEWLTAACRNTHIAFQLDYFDPNYVSSEPSVAVAEIYRDIDILELRKGKKVAFEVSGEMTEYAAERGFEGDNGDLEHELEERAKAAKVRGLKWSSEGDTLVVQAAKVDALRWVIDAIHDA